MCAEMACLVRSEGVTVLTLNTDALVERYRQCSCSPVDVPRWASGSGAEKPHVWARPLRYHVTQWQGRDVSAANSPHSLLQQHLMLWVPGAGLWMHTWFKL